MVKSWKFVALQVLALLLQLALAATVYGVVAQAQARAAAAEARTVEVATRAAQVRVYEFQRGIFSMCLSVYYGDARTCNQIVAASVDYKVYSDPKYSFGFEPPH